MESFLPLVIPLGIGFVAFAFTKLRKARPPLPPGPPGKPLVGNILDLPFQNFDWEIYSKWAEIYGPIISLSGPGLTVVVLSSYNKAVELLDKRGSRYSGRAFAPMIMSPKLLDWGDALTVLPYGPQLRGYRKLFHDMIGTPKAVSNFHPQLSRIGKKFLQRVVSDPTLLLEHCLHLSGSVILKIAYGYSTKDENDEFMRISKDAMQVALECADPTKFWVNIFPFLENIPAWFPGAEFKRIADEKRHLYTGMVDIPLNFVKEQMRLGVAEESVVSKRLREVISSEEEFYLKHAAGSFFGEGSESTATWVHFFFLAMIMWPSVQEKLHVEMDAVVGDRLPDFMDQKELPYLEAVIKELARIHPIAPSGAPHTNSEDDIYDGYFIPKGSLIVPNIWKMCRDPDIYSKPEEFKPERFLGPNPEMDPRQIIFGFGRRICPGRFLAQGSIFITIALSVAAFDIQPVQDEATGTPIIPTIRSLSSGHFINRLSPFPCQITARNPELLSQWLEE